MPQDHLVRRETTRPPPKASAAGAAADTDGVTATSKAESADWALFTDWCIAAEVSSLPTNREVIQAFLDELPAARSTRLARVRRPSIGACLRISARRNSSS